MPTCFEKIFLPDIQTSLNQNPCQSKKKKTNKFPQWLNPEKLIQMPIKEKKGAF